MSPMFGKTVLITREKSQAKVFSKKVSEYGGNPVELPLLIFQYPDDLARIESTLKQLSEYDWIVFTSKNGVDYFFEFLEKYQIPQGILDHKKIAAVGKKTAATLADKGDFNIFVPKEFVAEALIEELKGMNEAKERFLLARGNLARSVLPEELIKMGHSVTDLIVYDTRINETRKHELVSLLMQKKIDVLTFTSPSSIENFITLLDGTNFREWLKECSVACIGPITKKKALANQMPVHICPKEYTIDGMIQAIISYISSEQKSQNSAKL